MADPYGLIFDGAPELGAQEQATETYAKLPATFGQAFGALAPSTVENIGSAVNAGLYEDSIWGRMTRATVAGNLGEAMAEGAPPPVDQELLNPVEPLADKQQRPAAEINKLAGEKITDVPMGVHLSDALIEAKQNEIERRNILTRYEDAHSWPVNFGTELISGLLDPVNAATAFVPGLGEEALLARLGSGLFGRVAARAAAQAAGTEVAQLPIEAMRYGLAREESSDFDLRSAFGDLAMGAAYGAVAGAGHALLGAGWGALKGRVQARTGAIPEPPLPAEEPPQPPLPTGPPAPEEEASRAAFAAGVERLTTMPAPEVNAAIGTAVGQIATERPVDVEPLVQLRTPQEPREHIGFENSDAEVRAAASALSPVAAGQVRLFHGGVTAPETGGPRWVAQDPVYAAHYREQGDLYYIDVPETSGFLRETYDRTGIPGAKPVYANVELPEEIARNLQPVLAQPTPGVIFAPPPVRPPAARFFVDVPSETRPQQPIAFATREQAEAFGRENYRAGTYAIREGPAPTAAPPRDPAAVVDQQRDLDHVGVFPGTPQNELAAAAEEARLAGERAAVTRETSPQGDILKEEQAKAPEDWIATAPGAPGAPPTAAVEGRVTTGAVEEKPLGQSWRDEARLILAEQQAQQLRVAEMEPEERAELEATQRGLTEAEDHTRALQAAAACQKENEV